MASFRGRPPKRRVTVKGGTVNTKEFFGAENFERLRKEIATEGTIAGEQLSPEERKEAFKASRDKVAFKNFVENFVGVKSGPKTQVGRGPGGGGVGAPPPGGPAQKMLPGTAVAPLAVRRPTQRKQEDPEVIKVSVKDVTPKKRAKVGDSLEKNVKIIRKTVDSILKTLVAQNKFFGKQAENERKALENQRRAGKEEQIEGEKDNKIKKAFDKTVKPFSNILDGILNYLTALFLGRAFVKLMDWIGDPANQGKIESIGRFLKDWWPALLGAYLIFGNSFTRFALGFVAKIGMWAARMTVAVIPKLLGAIAKNPKAAAAVGLFTAGATIPMLFPQTVNEQERKTDKASAEKGADKVRAELERKANNPNFYERLTGQDAEAKEQLFRMDTGQTKSYGFRKGGKVTTQSGQDVKGAGVDTQLIAARPGEVVINKETVDRVGAGFFLSLNKKYGGPNANKPKVAKNVQAASGGGLVLPAFANGGMVGYETNERPRGGTYMGQRGERNKKLYDAISQQLSQVVPSATQTGGKVLNNIYGELQKYNNVIAQQGPRFGQQILNQGQGLANQVGNFGTNQFNRANNYLAAGGLQKDVSKMMQAGTQYGAGLYDQALKVGNEALSNIQSGNLQKKVTETAQQIPKNAGIGIFDAFKKMGSKETYKKGSERMEKIQDKMITFGDKFISKLPDGPFKEMADKGLIPIPTGNATIMRNLTYLKAVMGPLGRPFKVLSNKEVDEMRRKTIEKTMNKSGLIVDPKTGEVKMNWNQEDINKGARGGGAYTDDLGPRGSAFNSTLGRFAASTKGKGNTLYTDDRYNFNKTVAEYAEMAKQGLMKGSINDATYFGASMIGRFAQDIGWLNQRALGSEIEIGKVDRSKIDPRTGKMKSPQQIAAEKAQKNKKMSGLTPTASDKKWYQSQQSKTPYVAPGGVGPVIPKPKTNQQKLVEKRPWYDKFGWFGGASAKNKKKQGGGITESTGMNIPGAGADRQAVLTQPGEYILPVDTVARLGGPNAIDRLVASTDSNSNAAKLGAMSKPSMAVGQPVMSGDMSMVSTLPPIVQSSGGGGGGGGGGVATKIPSVSVSSNSSRRNARTMYGLV